MPIYLFLLLAALCPQYVLADAEHFSVAFTQGSTRKVGTLSVEASILHEEETPFGSLSYFSKGRREIRDRLILGKSLSGFLDQFIFEGQHNWWVDSSAFSNEVKALVGIHSANEECLVIASFDDTFDITVQDKKVIDYRIGVTVQYLAQTIEGPKVKSIRTRLSRLELKQSFGQLNLRTPEMYYALNVAGALVAVDLREAPLPSEMVILSAGETAFLDEGDSYHWFRFPWKLLRKTSYAQFQAAAKNELVRTRNKESTFVSLFTDSQWWGGTVKKASDETPLNTSVQSIYGANRFMELFQQACLSVN